MGIEVLAWTNEAPLEKHALDWNNSSPDASDNTTQAIFAYHPLKFHNSSNPDWIARIWPFNWYAYMQTLKMLIMTKNYKLWAFRVLSGSVPKVGRSLWSYFFQHIFCASDFPLNLERGRTPKTINKDRISKVITEQALRTGEQAQSLPLGMDVVLRGRGFEGGEESLHTQSPRGF